MSSEATQEYLFDPDTYAMKDPSLLISGYTLEPAVLQEYGKLATRLRQNLVHLRDALMDAEEKLQAGDDVGLSGFFRSNNFHIPSTEEMEKLHTEEELENTIRIAEMCKDYDILGKPNLPQFPCPGPVRQ